jgi:hypothetical protein
MSGTTSGRVAFVAVSIAAIWLSALAASLLAPSLVTGSEHETIPLVAAVDWLWAALATGFIVLAAGLVRHGHRPSWLGAAFAVAVIWAAVAIVSVAGPSLVTGSDPTTVPLAALLSPLAGVIATAYVAIFAAASAQVAADEASSVGSPDAMPTPVAAHG